MKISPGQLRLKMIKDAPAVTPRVITVDPTELKPGDMVMSISDHEEDPPHLGGDIRVTVLRNEKEAPDA